MKKRGKMGTEHATRTVRGRYGSMSRTSGRPHHSYAHYEKWDASRPRGVRCYERAGYGKK